VKDQDYAYTSIGVVLGLLDAALLNLRYAAGLLKDSSSEVIALDHRFINDAADKVYEVYHDIADHAEDPRYVLTGVSSKSEIEARLQELLDEYRVEYNKKKEKKDDR